MESTNHESSEPKNGQDQNSRAWQLDRVGVVVGFALAIFGALITIGLLFLPASTLVEKALIFSSSAVLSVGCTTGFGAWRSLRRFVATAISGGVAIACLAALSVVAETGQTSPSPKVTIQTKNQQTVSRAQGFVIRGSVTDLGNDSIWLFDFNNAYFIDVQATVPPFSGNWKAADRPLGGASQSLPFQITVVVVLATPQCDRVLQANLSAHETRLPSLPPGCDLIPPPITVTVNRP